MSESASERKPAAKRGKARAAGKKKQGCEARKPLSDPRYARERLRWAAWGRGRHRDELQARRRGQEDREREATVEREQAG